MILFIVSQKEYVIIYVWHWLKLFAPTTTRVHSSKSGDCYCISNTLYIGFFVFRHLNNPHIVNETIILVGFDKYLVLLSWFEWLFCAIPITAAFRQAFAGFITAANLCGSKCRLLFSVFTNSLLINQIFCTCGIPTVPAQMLPSSLQAGKARLQATANPLGRDNFPADSPLCLPLPFLPSGGVPQAQCACTFTSFFPSIHVFRKESDQSNYSKLLNIW